MQFPLSRCMYCMYDMDVLVLYLDSISITTMWSDLTPHVWIYTPFGRVMRSKSAMDALAIQYRPTVWECSFLC